MLLIATLSPIPVMDHDLVLDNVDAGGAPSSGGSRSDGASVEDLFTFLRSPPAILFGTSISNVGDVNGDGIDDILVGTNESSPNQNPPWYRRNCLLLGREDRDLRTEQLVHIQNMSAYWFARNGRWAGDVNGDGHDDILSFGSHGGFGDPNWVWGSGLSVRLGSEDLDDLTRTKYLVIAPPGANWTNYLGKGGRCHPVGVGDVNGDGFNDVCVVSDPWPPWDSEETYPGVILLFYGNEDGIGKRHDVAVEIPYGEGWMWRRLGNVLHGDVNGDGHSDLLMSTAAGSNQSLVRIHLGSEDGVARLPDRRIQYFDVPKPTPYTPFYPFFRSPLDLNGDEYDDFILSSYKSRYPLYKGDDWVRVYMGDDGLGELNESQVLTFKDAAQKFMEVADINGDGLHDIVRLQPTTRNWTQDGELRVGIDLAVEVHFNAGGSFTEEPDWEVTLEKIPTRTDDFITDFGDFDGDGHDDLALAQHAYEWEAEGNLLVIWGGAIMDGLTSIELEGGPLVYARHRAYDFTVRANPVGLPQLPSRLQLALDPDDADVLLECSIDSGRATFTEVRDPRDLVEITSGPTDIEIDTANNDARVHFKVIFDWAWPHEDLCKGVVILMPGDAAEVRIPTPNLFRVENDLALQGAISVEGEWQGPVEEEGWVRVGENLSVSGARVVYEGTADLHPPPSSCKVRAVDDDGTSAETEVSEGGSFQLVLQSDGVTDFDETLSLTLADLPGSSTSTSELRFGIRVDGEAPTFANPVPEDEDWHSSSEVMVSITADDGNTSGADPLTLEYSFSTGGAGAFGDWTREGLGTSAHGATAEGLTTVSFPDGPDNLVRWRVLDRVGNPAVSEPFRVPVDTLNVTFSDPVPTPGEWLTFLAMDCGVTIRDEEGSGIDVSTIEYRVSARNLSQYGLWQDWDEAGQVDDVVVTTVVGLELAESPYNYIQWRAFDIAGNGLTTSPHYRIPTDVTPPAFSDLAPTEVQAESEVQCWASVTDGPWGSGVPLDTVEYRFRVVGGDYSAWTPAGMTGTYTFNRFSVLIEFPDGTGNAFQFRAWDLAGNGPSVSEELNVTVDTRPPTIHLLSPDPDDRLTGSEVTFTLALEDELTGIDPSRVWYRVVEAGPLDPQDWTSIEGVEGGHSVTATLQLDLAPGPANRVQFRAADMGGKVNETEVLSFHVNRPPTAVIARPLNGTDLLDIETLVLDASGSEDPDGDVLECTWTIEGVDGILVGQNVTTRLDEGTYRVDLRVEDPFGASDNVNVTVNVEALRTSTTGGGDFPYALLVLAIVVVTVVLVVTYLYVRRRGSMEEPPAT